MYLVSDSQDFPTDVNNASRRGVNPILELVGVTKAFPGIIANNSIDLKVLPGEIHALVGENGAGKSTLVKIIYGLLRLDEGEIRWDGNPFNISTPRQARNLGIGMVFQHFSLFEGLTVLENIALSIDTKWNMAELKERMLKVSKNYGLSLEPDRYVNSLSVGERQRIEIVRCLLQSPKLLILDEPTSVLTPQEAERLFETLKILSQEGCSILYISHKLEEIRNLCTSATILRRGAVVSYCDPRCESVRAMAEMMIGERLPEIDKGLNVTNHPDRIIVKSLSSKSSDPLCVNLKDISLSVRGGEILGIAGVAGNGQTELMAALSGEDNQLDSSSIIQFDNRLVTSMNPAERRALGAGFIPEQRQGHAAIGEMNLVENTLLTARKKAKLENKGFVRFFDAMRFTEKIISTFDVRTTGVKAEAGSLSGGNLQKFIVGREMLQHPGILVIAQPTWGVDVGAAVVLRRTLLDLAKNGCAVLMISQDLDEIYEICSRIAVIAEGKLSSVWDIGAVSLDQIGLLMSGHEIRSTHDSKENHI